MATLYVPNCLTTWALTADETTRESRRAAPKEMPAARRRMGILSASATLGGGGT
jgi:hypothetical protein